MHVLLVVKTSFSWSKKNDSPTIIRKVPPKAAMGRCASCMIRA